MNDFGLPTPELSLAIAPVALPGPPRERLTEAVAFASSLGIRAVQLDATMPGIRPRDLGRSSRREIASIVRREGMVCSGIDLWIPPEHFLDDARADRAMSATIETIRFVAEVAPLTRGELAPSAGEPFVSLTLPSDGAHLDVRAPLAEEAARNGVRLADHAWPVDTSFEHDHLGVGIDPARVLLAGGISPPRALAQHAPRLVSARLSDAEGTTRLRAGEGGLDLFEYAATALTCELASPLIVDVREVRAPRDASRRIIEDASSLAGGP